MSPGLRPFYKYSSPDGAVATLESGSARYSTPLLFNDPFDVQAGLHFDFDLAQLHRSVVDRIGELAEQRDKPQVDSQDVWGMVVLEAWRHFCTHGFDRERWMDLTASSFASLLEVIRETQADYQKHWHEIQLPQMRVFCVSEERDSLLMWAHYAKDHTGAVLELWSLPEEDNPLSVAVPVNYVERPIAFYSLKEFVDDMVGVQKLDIRSLYRRYACTKSVHWAYEKEWRVWYPLSKTQKYDFSPIRPNELKAIYLGCRSEKSFRDKVQRLVAEKFPKTRILIASRAAGAYELEYTDA
jgi:hypothetical protein